MLTTKPGDEGIVVPPFRVEEKSNSVAILTALPGGE